MNNSKEYMSSFDYDIKKEIKILDREMCDHVDYENIRHQLSPVIHNLFEDTTASLNELNNVLYNETWNI
jgi:hypothetical protein